MTPPLDDEIAAPMPVRESGGTPEPTSGEAPKLQGAAAFIRSTIGKPLVRVSTGIPTLDAATRGGLMAAKITVIGGAPNAGKTTLAVQLAERCATNGHPVAILAVDEDREGVLWRIGQLHGLSLEDLENDVEGAREKLARVLDDLPNLLVLDGEDGATLEDLLEELAELSARMPGAPPAVAVFDSIQTLRAKGTDDAGSPRERADAVVHALKRCRARGWLVIATCELARGAYRNRDARNNINPLAAFKESGSIEYAATTALVLVSVAGEAGLVDVEMPKNKRGASTPFRLELSPARARYREVARPESGEIGAIEGPSFEECVAAVREPLLAELSKAPGIGITELTKRLRKRGEHVRAAVRGMLEAHELENRGSERAMKLYTLGASDRATEQAIVPSSGDRPGRSDDDPRERSSHRPTPFRGDDGTGRSLDASGRSAEGAHARDDRTVAP